MKSLRELEYAACIAPNTYCMMHRVANSYTLTTHQYRKELKMKTLRMLKGRMWKM